MNVGYGVCHKIWVTVNRALWHMSQMNVRMNTASIQIMS